MPKTSGRLPAVTTKPTFTTRLMRKMAAELGRVMAARWPADAGPCPGAEVLGLAWLRAKATGRSMVEMLDQVTAHPRDAARTLALWMEPKRRWRTTSPKKPRRQTSHDFP